MLVFKHKEQFQASSQGEPQIPCGTKEKLGKSFRPCLVSFLPQYFLLAVVLPSEVPLKALCKFVLFLSPLTCLSPLNSFFPSVPQKMGTALRVLPRRQNSQKPIAPATNQFRGTEGRPY